MMTMANKINATLLDGNKAVPIDQLPEEAWSYLFGGPDEDAKKLEDLYNAVPWMFRGVGIRAQAAQSVPFSIMQGDDEIDNSDDYQNVIGWLPDPFELIYLTEGALSLHGRSYWFKERNLLKTKGVRWLFPLTVKPKLDSVNGLVGFIRTIRDKQEEFDLEDFVYVRQPNLWGELGHGKSPAHAAITAAGVLMSVDEFTTAFFKRGAIKATLLTSPSDTSERERKRLLGWWKRVFSGLANAWQTDVVASEVKATVIGEGLKELSDQALTKEKREDISTAMGVPQSILFSSGVSNRSVRETDQLSFYQETIIPDIRLIERSANAQLFHPEGYHLKFTPQEMQIFQEDEKDRSSALFSLTNSGMPLVAALDVLGFDISEDSMTLIEASSIMEETEPRNEERGRQQIREIVGGDEASPENIESIQGLNGAQITAALDMLLGVTNGTVAPQVAFELLIALGIDPERAQRMIDAAAKHKIKTEPSEMRSHLRKWKRKSMNSLKRGKGALVEFDTDHIPLEATKTEDEIKMVFDDAMQWGGYP
jgi:phage portal protein BeeE